MPSEYRVAPQIAARLVGLLTIAVALLVLVTTGVVAVFDLHTSLLLVPALVGLAALVAAAVVLSRRGWVVRLTDEGYRVQWVRGVGVPAARWTEVEDAVTTTSAGSPVVVLRLRNGDTTTIPVDFIAGDREEFVRDLQRHLQQGQGLRPF
ncbi:hypothetical protein [Nocardioides piscis]|uniref:Uncharacterized protein n=1 Tax=Nocardioides piscis TaxID=2714938 RepID=A0A6G7YD41_9ACTN|nr:hypothetical protein [Nocardioides piscis]QIK74690.1 hypothetical protein G7071_03900 [Nocardioides piscis]